MAVAVATRPHTSQISTVHAQSAQDALLDALLSSCEKPANPPLKSFGRDLKPYFAVTDCVTPAINKEAKASNRKVGRNKPSPPPVAAAAAAAAASTKQATQNPKSIAKSAHTNRKVSVGKGESVVIHATAEKACPQMNRGDVATMLAWAGPGFCVAPSPDKVPLPTSLLLE